MAQKSLRFVITALDKTGQAFETVKNKVGGLKSQFKSLTSSVKGIGVAFAAAFAGAAFRAVSTMVDQVDKLAIKLGVGTEALSEYRLIAALSGTSLEQLGQSMRDLAKNVSDAARGAATQADALATLGLRAEDLIALPLDKQFEIVGDRLRGVNNQADKVRIAMALMGEAGLNMIPIFEQGADSIAQLRNEAKELAVTITEEQADAIAQMNDDWTKLTAVIQGTAKDLIALLAPAIGLVIRMITEVIKFINKFVKGLYFARDSIAAFYIRVNELFGLIDKSVADEAIKEIADKWRDVKDETSATKKETEELIGKIKEANAELGKRGRSTGGGSTSRKPANDNKKGKDPIKDVKDEIKEVPDVVDDAMQDVREGFKDILTGMNDDAESLGGRLVNIYKRIADRITSHYADQVLDMVFGAGNAGGAAGSGGGFGGLLSGAISGLSDFFGGFFADGGDFRSGKPIVVGERGPEIIMPRHAGTVIPNHAMNGGNVVVNMNIATPDVRGFRESQGQIAAKAAQQIASARRNM